jgi:hypothetical protein
MWAKAEGCGILHLASDLVYRAPPVAQTAYSGGIRRNALPAQRLSLGVCVSETRSDTLHDQSALQFGYGTQHGKGHVTGWRCGVHFFEYLGAILSRSRTGVPSNRQRGPEIAVWERSSPLFPPPKALGSRAANRGLRSRPIERQQKGVCRRNHHCAVPEMDRGDRYGPGGDQFARNVSNAKRRCISSGKVGRLAVRFHLWKSRIE